MLNLAYQEAIGLNRWAGEEPGAVQLRPELWSFDSSSAYHIKSHSTTNIASHYGHSYKDLASVQTQIEEFKDPKK